MNDPGEAWLVECRAALIVCLHDFKAVVIRSGTSAVRRMALWHWASLALYIVAWHQWLDGLHQLQSWPVDF